MITPTRGILSEAPIPLRAPFLAHARPLLSQRTSASPDSRPHRADLCRSSIYGALSIAATFVCTYRRKVDCSSASFTGLAIKSFIPDS